MLTVFPGQTHQPLDVELALDPVPMNNPLGLEDDDFPALGPAEIVGQAVHEQMIARRFRKTDDRFPFAKLRVFGSVRCAAQTDRLRSSSGLGANQTVIGSSEPSW